MTKGVKMLATDGFGPACPEGASQITLKLTPILDKLPYQLSGVPPKDNNITHYGHYSRCHNSVCVIFLETNVTFFCSSFFFFYFLIFRGKANIFS